MEVIDRILQTLGIPEGARRVYQDLVEHGGTTARTLSARLSMTRPSVYDQIKILKTRGLVLEREVDGKTEFVVHDICELEKLIADEKKELDTLQKEFSHVSSELAARAVKNAGPEPKIKFISGRAGILQSMHDMLWDEKLVLKVVWPYRAMLETLGEEELARFNEKRLRNNIRLETIWAHGEKGGSHIWQGAGDRGVVRRHAPQGLAPRMGYTIYDSKVLFVSSAAESYGFTVQSPDFADLMRQQFQLLWEISEPEKEKRNTKNP